MPLKEIPVWSCNYDAVFQHHISGCRFSSLLIQIQTQKNKNLFAFGSVWQQIPCCATAGYCPLVGQNRPFLRILQYRNSELSGGSVPGVGSHKQYVFKKKKKTCVKIHKPGYSCILLVSRPIIQLIVAQEQLDFHDLSENQRLLWLQGSQGLTRFLSKPRLTPVVRQQGFYTVFGYSITKTQADFILSQQWC